MEQKLGGRSLEEVIGFHFKNPDLLLEALTHKSHAVEKNQARQNERLEFLGDSILSAIVAHHLYEKYPGEDEGRLSKRKSLLVSRAALARWARDLDIGMYLKLGAGEDTSGGRSRTSILANALEALIGAVYLDGGFKASSAFIGHWLSRQEDGFKETDYKSRLQEILQKKYKSPPDYELTKATGPDHDKTFVVSVKLGQQVLGTGVGKSKKEAEQAAAWDALNQFVENQK
ncbi:MAG: ribonuclease III [Elusimicrobia bacterium]|nr:ribonuclease III [Elusimicrobiota bacterium]